MLVEGAGCGPCTCQLVRAADAASCQQPVMYVPAKAACMGGCSHLPWFRSFLRACLDGRTGCYLCVCTTLQCQVAAVVPALIVLHLWLHPQPLFLYSYSYSNWSGHKRLPHLREPNKAHGALFTLWRKLPVVLSMESLQGCFRAVVFQFKN